MSTICTLTDYKTFIGLPNPADPHPKDTVNQILLDGMEEAVKGYVDVALQTTVVTNKLFDAKIEDMLTLGVFPIQSIQQIVFDVDSNGGGGSVVSTENYHHDEISIFFRDLYTNRGRGCIRVDYTHGYATVPGDVKLAILQATKIFAQYHSSDQEHTGGSSSKKDESTTIGGKNSGVWDADSGLPFQVKAMLQKYRFLGYDNIGYAQRTK